ncbi:MAG: DnaD domain protein [Defluviitaleaceae bacterium]|nr:DnaD domain protein [Defluviitaleaceae bacterium]
MKITDDFLELLTETNPLYSILFIYAKTTAELEICPKKYAEKFKIQEEEVIKAFQYFQLKRLIHLKIEEKLQIEFIEKNENIERKLIIPQPRIVFPEEEQTMEENQNFYSPEEIAYYQSFEEVKEIFDIAENMLGSLLNPLQQSVILSFYEDYRFSKETIKEILKYSVENFRKRADQLSEIAKNWEDIKNDISHSENSNYASMNEILKALSVSKRDITPKLTSRINEWLKNHSKEMILEACDKTIMKFAKPNLVYTEAILNDWEKKGIKTIASMIKDNENHNEKFNRKFKEKSQSVKKSKFNNFENSNIDYNDIVEKLQGTY